MLGERQWAWLKAGLKQSTAKLKFIASGSVSGKNMATLTHGPASAGSKRAFLSGSIKKALRE